MRGSNPTLSEKIFEQLKEGEQPNHMTAFGTTNKAIILLGILVASAIFTWHHTAVAGPSAALPYLIGGGLSALVIAFITFFVPHISPYTSPVYAVLEGLALGALSQLVNARYPGIALQAVLLTCCIAIGMFLLYNFRIIRLSERMKSIIIGATVGIALLYLVNLVLVFGFQYSLPFIHQSGPIGIGFSLFVVWLASMNLLIDFEFIEHGEQLKAPKWMEWYGAFGLTVTIAWLYIEVLRLLRKLRG